MALGIWKSSSKSLALHSLLDILDKNSDICSSQVIKDGIEVGISVKVFSVVRCFFLVAGTSEGCEVDWVETKIDKRRIWNVEFTAGNLLPVWRVDRVRGDLVANYSEHLRHHRPVDVGVKLGISDQNYRNLLNSFKNTQWYDSYDMQSSDQRWKIKINNYFDGCFLVVKSCRSGIDLYQLRFPVRVQHDVVAEELVEVIHGLHFFLSAGQQFLFN